MAEFPALMLWTDAYLADTTHLNTVQHGAYLLLLMTAWRRPDCALPDDDEYLARVTRQRVNNWQRWIRPWLEPFFTVADGVWIQKRLKREREHAALVSKRRSESASKRHFDNARTHYQSPTLPRDQEPPNPLNANETTPANAGVKPCYPYPHQQPVKKRTPNGVHKESPPAQPATGPDGPVDSFPEWYASYPRKVGRKKAETAYHRAEARASAEEILDGLNRAIADWKARGSFPEFVPHPATWLNRDGWADEHYKPVNGHGDPFLNAAKELLGQLSEQKSPEGQTDEIDEGTVLEGACDRQPDPSQLGSEHLLQVGRTGEADPGDLRRRIAVLPGTGGNGWLRPMGTAEGEVAILGRADRIH